MAGGRNLMSSTEPYIHSNYENFKAQYSWGAGFRSKKDIYHQRLDFQIKKLQKIASALKQETSMFLGSSPGHQMRLDIYDFLSQTTDSNDFDIAFAMYFLDYLQLDSFYNETARMIDGVTRQAFEKFFSGILTQQEIADIIQKDDIVGALMETLKNQKFFEKSAKQQIDFFSKGGKNLGFDITNLHEFANNIFGSPMKKALRAKTSQILRKRINYLLKQVSLNSFKNISTFYNVILWHVGGLSGSKFKNYFDSKYKKQYDNQIFIKKFNKLMLTLKGKFDFPIMNISKTKIGEIRGEELFGTVLEETTDSVILQIGQEKEENARISIKKFMNFHFSKSKILKYSDAQLQQKETSDIRGSAKSIDKQARADMMIYNSKTNRSAGVQSKNFIESMLQKIEGKKTQTTSLYSPHSGENIINFVERTKTYMGSEIEADSLSYVMANIIWFSTAGTIEKGKNGPAQTITDPGMNELTQELASYIVDLLGITYAEIFDEIDIIPEISNIFYLLNNRYMVPTYLIIENLINIISTDRNKFNNTEGYINLSLTTTLSQAKESAGDAINLKKSKKKAVGKLDGSKYYQDSNLVSVGKNKGKEIVNAQKADLFSFKKIYMDFNIDKISETAYSF